MATKTTSPGEIRMDGLYTLAEIRRRLDLGQTALRTARRKGLRVRMIGRRGYILGSDIIQYFEREAKESPLSK